MNKVVNSKQELIRLLKENKDELLSFGILRIGIFGSFVRNEANESSDIDFFVEINPEQKTLKNFVGLARYLQNMSGRKVELVTPQSLNKFTGQHIINQVEYVSLAA